MSQSKERDQKLIHYGEMLMRKVRNEPKPDDEALMASIRKELQLSEQDIVSEVEAAVKKHY